MCVCVCGWRYVCIGQVCEGRGRMGVCVWGMAVCEVGVCGTEVCMGGQR